MLQWTYYPAMPLLWSALCARGTPAGSLTRLAKFLWTQCAASLQ